MSLIKGKQKASDVNPRVLIIFAHPKTGKTRALAQLEDSLLIDVDGSSSFYECNATEKIDSYKKFVALVKELKSLDKPFKFLVFDTITKAMPTIVRERAIAQLNKDLAREGETPVSPNFMIEGMAYGKGQLYLREAAKDIIATLSKYCQYLIVVGHTNDKSITKSGETLSVLELDLVGKLKNILAADVDGIGLLYRSAVDENSISFVHSDGVLGGTRSPHLDGQTIVISKKEGNTLETFWDKIYV